MNVNGSRSFHIQKSGAIIPYVPSLIMGFTAAMAKTMIVVIKDTEFPVIPMIKLALYFLLWGFVFLPSAAVY